MWKISDDILWAPVALGELTLKCCEIAQGLGSHSEWHQLLCKTCTKAQIFDENLIDVSLPIYLILAQWCHKTSWSTLIQIRACHLLCTISWTKADLLAIGPLGTNYSYSSGFTHKMTPCEWIHLGLGLQGLYSTTNCADNILGCFTIILQNEIARVDLFKNLTKRWVLNDCNLFTDCNTDLWFLFDVC